MKTITIYHSPDADDAFMFYGLTAGGVSVPGYEFRHDLCDIESLNRRALAGELDVTAVSVHAYGYLGDQYSILQCGASMGGADYGPRLIVQDGKKLQWKKKLRIAIPGEFTSAALALKLYLRQQELDAELVPFHFELIQEAVRSGEIEAGVIIHEGQITHMREGLTTVLDLGAWWWEATELPLPLGINIVRRSLGAEAMRAVYRALKDSIEYSLSHRQEALQYALSYGRGLSLEDADTFVGMYVNEWTRDLGEAGRRSIELFLSEATRAGFVAEPQISFVP